MGVGAGAVAGDAGHHTFKTLNLEIKFPFVPYNIQKAMMAKVVQTLSNKEHSLIESPTGTGKTLVLLCSALAWQRQSQENGQPLISSKLRKLNHEKRMERLKNKPCSCGRRPNRTELATLKEAKGNEKQQKGDCDKLGAENVYQNGDDDLAACKKIKLEPASDNFASSPYFNRKAKNQTQSFINIHEATIELDGNPQNFAASSYFDAKTTTNCKSDPDVIIIGDDDATDGCEFIAETKPDKAPTENKAVGGLDTPMCRNCKAVETEELFKDALEEDSMDGDTFVTGKIKSKIPRIYYGTRTHKQITQVVRELNKTPYKRNLKMCILSSRDRTCINSDVKDLANKNDRCQELIKNKQNSNNPNRRNEKLDLCPFYSDTQSLSQSFSIIHDEFKDKAWDLEDAATFGRNSCACPYYGIRSLQDQAEITFCPYNYLIDPIIRKALQINLSNSIIILDEAHNIEDVCRDAASFVIDSKQIDDLLDTFRMAASHYVQGSGVADAYAFFRGKFQQLQAAMRNFNFPSSKSQDSNFIMSESLSQEGIRNFLDSIGLGSKELQNLKENFRILKGDDDEVGGSKNAQSQESLMSFFQMQFISQLNHTLDFMYSSNNKYFNDFRGWVAKSLDRESGKPGGNRMNRSETTGEKHVWHFSLWCMNSGIAFEKIHSNAWSVIVASGTLAPIDSLKSELGCTFANVFEGAHVIEQNRVFSSILSYGPNRVDLNCSYGNSSQLTFQDEVGLIVRDVCLTVPHGVLVFFPSYDRMEALYQRWFTKGFIKEIQKAGKKVFREQKKQSTSEFEQALENYHRFATTKGALLFAVFRGKVSEGIDFSDDAARAVISIGIPYPNVKDVVVDLKKRYNDIARASRPELMPGTDWYVTQAFRALNQALGRCVRHKEDWGSIIMIDSRLRTQGRYISKWLRNYLNVQNDYTIVLDGLKQFIETRTSSD